MSFAAQRKQITANANNTNIQSSYNSTNYNNDVICKASCENIQNNIYLVIENSLTGDINFNQTCNSSMDCVVNNELEFVNNTQFTNEQQANATAKNKSLFIAIPTKGSTYISDIKISANTSNFSTQSSYNITNVNISKDCTSSSLNVQSDIFTIIKNSTTGDINFSQQGNATASCISTNSAKVSNYTSLKSTQVATSEASDSMFDFAGIGAIIFTILFIIILLVVGLGVLKSVGGKAPSASGQPPASQPPADNQVALT